MVKALKIGIIGGGAAGMMCAATILESKTSSKFEIHLFDKNPKLGVKVALTGGGRCNVTTGINDSRILLSKYIRGSSFVRPAMSAFPPIKVREWFEGHNVPLKEEDDNRVFPVSNQGEDIVKVFENICQDERMQLHFDEPVITIVKKLKKFEVKTVDGSYKLDVLVITTGGNAYQITGSTGDGYTLAKSLGHNITKLNASLNSFATQEEWCYELAGISLPEARFDFELNTSENTVEKKSVKGPMIFTHFGISGPVVFALAANIAFEDINENNPFKVRLIPDAKTNFDICNSIIIKEIAKNGSRTLIEVIRSFVPRRFAVELLKIADVKSEIGAELTKEERLSIVRLLTGGLELNLKSKMAGVEFVTAGGIELDEIDRKTMESKKQNGLYFAGEVLNIDAVTGGFNLQSAWATGRSAGNAIVKLKLSAVD